MTADKIIYIVYGILLIVGGYMGYSKAGSQMSLIMGAVSGVVVLAGTYLVYQSNSAGHWVITATSALLAVMFLMRVIKTQKMMPSGMLLLLSIIVLVVSLLQLKK